MGFLSKLFGKAASDAAADMFGDEKHFFEDNGHEAAPEPVRQQPTTRREQPQFSGSKSWGDVMPAEENQFSFNGSYVEYFNKVFREEFPSYRIRYEAASGRAATIFTFDMNGRTALIVELMSERSSVKKLRNECQLKGIPYLRFYYDHFGWWNTRSYVTDRVRSALS